MGNEDQERRDEYKDKPLHLLLAFRRKKDNEHDYRDVCYRQVIREYDGDLESLKKRCSSFPGVWRIHETVNCRDRVKARKLLMKALIDAPELWEHRIDSLWKTSLLKSRAERKIMLDCDNKDQFLAIKDLLQENNIVINMLRDTPNGFHIITDVFDTRIFDGRGELEVDIKRDGYVFIERFDNRAEV